MLMISYVIIINLDIRYSSVELHVLTH